LSLILEIGKAQGKTAMLTFVDDPDSPEGRAAAEYVKSHSLLPRNYEETTEEEIAENGKKLLSPKTPNRKKKEILMLLAHLGVYESFQILKQYRANPDPDLKVWADMAFDECQTFVRQSFSPEAIASFNAVLKTGRNEPCPCGSGKKFKKCCGEKGKE
jgi:uncharacterized protein YecA (UPF0149 family)